MVNWGGLALTFDELQGGSLNLGLFRGVGPCCPNS